MNIEGDEIDTALELEVEVPEFEEEQQEGEGDTIIAFADDEAEEEPPLVKTLRDQIRERDRKIAQLRRAPAVDDDPEPAITDRPRSVADFDYDEDRFNAAIDDHLAAKEAHSAWKARQLDREAAQTRAHEEQTKRVEKQRNALGVADYDTRAASVKETLSDAQLAILINGADNPAQLIYALGRSQTRLALLAGEENLAKFAVQIGKMEKEVKVTKKVPPAPETQVRGATASLTQSVDKHLARLEAEAAKTGDRSAIAAYRREQRQKDQKAA